MTSASAMKDAPELYAYDGKMRRVLGKLTYPQQPRPGVLVGPDAWGEICVVLGPLPDGRTVLGLAVRSDIVAATARIIEHGPESSADEDMIRSSGLRVPR